MRKYKYWFVGILINLLIMFSPLTGDFIGYPRWDGPFFMALAATLGVYSILFLDWHYNTHLPTSEVSKT